MSGKLRKIFADGKKKLVGFASAGCPNVNLLAISSSETFN